MIECPECSGETERQYKNYLYQECGLDNITLKNWEMDVCKNCNAEMISIPDERFSKILTELLLQQAYQFDWKTIRFMRSIMGLKVEELAKIIDVDCKEICRWENNQKAIDPFNDLKLRVSVIDHSIHPSKRDKIKLIVLNIFNTSYNQRRKVSSERFSVSNVEGNLQIT